LDFFLKRAILEQLSLQIWPKNAQNGADFSKNGKHSGTSTGTRRCH